MSSGNVTFASNSTFYVQLQGTSPGLDYDQLKVSGTVSVIGANLSLWLSFAPVEGDQFVIINNDGTDPISGTFKGLPQGSILNFFGAQFLVNYSGGAGNNDLVLTLTNTALKLAGLPVVLAGNGNAVIEPNECNDLLIPLINKRTSAVSNILALLSTSTPGVIVTQPNSYYPTLPAGGMGTNITKFQLRTLPTFVCGSDIQLNVEAGIQDDSGFSMPFVLHTGTPGTPIRLDNNSVSTIAPGASLFSSMGVSNLTSPIAKVSASLYLQHSHDGDLSLFLRAPDGTTLELSSGNGGNGNDYGTACAPDSNRTTFDDVATTSITSGTAPFAGSFRPETPFSALIGKSVANANGSWLLQVVNASPSRAATLNCWSLFISPAACVDGGGECEGCPGKFTGSITASDPAQTGRFAPGDPPSTCGLIASCPTPLPVSAIHYDVYTFTNGRPMKGLPDCVTVTLRAACSGGNSLFAAAYLAPFDPANICSNLLGHIGASPNPFGSFSFEAFPGDVFDIVVQETTPNAGCSQYFLNVTGVACPPPTLDISRVADPTKVALDWTTAAGGFLLEAASNLNSPPPFVFQAITNPVIVIDGKYVVTNSVSGADRFYRLRQP